MTNRTLTNLETGGKYACSFVSPLLMILFQLYSILTLRTNSPLLKNDNAWVTHSYNDSVIFIQYVIMGAGHYILQMNFVHFYTRCDGNNRNMLKGGWCYGAPPWNSVCVLEGGYIISLIFFIALRMIRGTIILNMSVSVGGELLRCWSYGNVPFMFKAVDKQKKTTVELKHSHISYIHFY